MITGIPVDEGGCWEIESQKKSGSTLPGAPSTKPRYLNSGEEVWSLVTSQHGALPELRREKLESEELMLKSEFPFSEHCPVSDFA